VKKPKNGQQIPSPHLLLSSKYHKYLFLNDSDAALFYYQTFPSDKHLTLLSNREPMTFVQIMTEPLPVKFKNYISTSPFEAKYPFFYVPSQHALIPRLPKNCLFRYHLS